MRGVFGEKIRDSVVLVVDVYYFDSLDDTQTPIHISERKSVHERELPHLWDMVETFNKHNTSPYSLGLRIAQIRREIAEFRPKSMHLIKSA